VAQSSFSWSPGSVPRRGTTYTLMAGTGPGQPQGQGYFLTTTVHARIPEFESGTRTPWAGGTTKKGHVTFSTAGVEVRDENGAWGTVSADKADLNDLVTKRAEVKDQLTVGGGMKVSHDGTLLFETMPDRVWFHKTAEFKEWVTFGAGISVVFGEGTLAVDKNAGGVIVWGGDLQVQQGKLSVSTGNPPQVRYL
jgi:hypothetical protein